MMFMGVEMDNHKEREVFERLPLAKLAIESEYVYYNKETNSYWPNEDFCPSDAPETMNFAWEAWQAAKAQAVPEAKPSHCVTLTCAQLREAFMFGAPDEDDQEQLETEMTITWSEDGHSGKGYYCYYSELPEEGAIFLDEVIEAQEQSNA